MNREEYIPQLVDYFVNCKIEDFDEETRHQVRRCLLDYLGCAVFAAEHGCSQDFMKLIYRLGPGEGRASIWGQRERLSPILAAFANAVRTSSIEMDDCSGIGASVHPGVYVMSSALAVWEASGASEEDFIRAVVFGYDVCMRMGLLATERVRELGLHGPGMVGGMAAAAAAGLLKGLSSDKLYDALCMTASLLPVCPFTTFMEGADAKDLYGGWGVYLGMFSVEAAEMGLTGPHHLLDGPKSLSWLFSGTQGTSVVPGSHFYINDISFKEFSACHSVHPAMTAIRKILEKYPLDAADIKHVTVSTYPYSYALNEGVKEPLSSSSARLSLTFTTAVALWEGKLSPAAFLPDGLSDERYCALSQKISVEKNDGYGDGPFSIRGTKITVWLKDGTIYEEEVLGSQWDQAPGDQELIDKFFSLTDGCIGKDQAEKVKKFAMEEGSRDIGVLVEALCKKEGGSL